MTDITEIPARDGKLYVSAIFDCYDLGVLGLVSGMQFRDYLRFRKLAFALKQVCDTDDGILNIALDYGFSSHESFTRAFKDAYGIDALIEQIKTLNYRQHHTYLSEVKAAQVKWNLNSENEEAMVRFLPVMQTDITLRLDDEILIIDAKYYGHTLQKQFDKYSLHSGNVYQIYTYVKNQDKIDISLFSWIPLRKVNLAPISFTGAWRKCSIQY